MLAALLVNQPSIAPGPDRYYYELLRRKKRARKKAEFERSETEKKEQLARLAYQQALSAKPEEAEQIVAPFKVQRPDSKRYEVNWAMVIESIVSYECLCALMIEIEEEDLIALLASSEA